SCLSKRTRRGSGLLAVAGQIIEDVAIGWIAPEQAGAGERSEKQHFALESVWQATHRRGGANVADEAEDLLFLVKLLHGFCGPRRLVAIVRCDWLWLAALENAGGGYAV